MVDVTPVLSDQDQVAGHKNIITLQGCTPTPLAHYLKALGVLRLLAEQADVHVRGAWIDDKFVLTTALSKESIVEFFLHQYVPSPVIAPWNGGSGFHLKDQKSGIEGIIASETERLKPYRETIDAAVTLLERLKITEKTSGDEKEQLLVACRSYLPESAIGWLDSAYVLTSEGAKYPPLLGTGGNDGRLEFTNNFMQRVCDLFHLKTGNAHPSSEMWLRTALFDEATNELQKKSIGQFHPSAVGGNNQSAGFEAATIMNPWDYVLMIEGALILAGAAIRKLESITPGTLSYPFSVRQSGIGYGSSSIDDESSARAEIWLPLWDRSVSFQEMKWLMAEGRAQVAGRPAKNGLDFARAIATLGVDRGYKSFQRYGFQVRNGLSYFATPLGRFDVQEQPQVNLLNAIDSWSDLFFRRANDDKAPNSVTRAATNLKVAMMALTQQKGSRQLQAVLIALGECEAALARSFSWASDERSGVRPIQGLDERWVTECYDGSVEYRLAASLASLSLRYKPHNKSVFMPMRSHMAPVDCGVKDGRQWTTWQRASSGKVVTTPNRNLVWGRRTFAENLCAVMNRRLLLANQSGHKIYQDAARVTASLSDVALFIEGRTDDLRMTELLCGLSLVDWQNVTAQSFDNPMNLAPDASYAALKMCFAGKSIAQEDIPLVPAIVRKAQSGDRTALRLALQRLRASGLPLALDTLWVPGPKMQRLAASLLFPISSTDLHALRASIVRPTNS